MSFPAEWKIDSTWTLFLDRDGVINVRFPGDYVKRAEEFEFLPGAAEAIAKLSRIFGRIIVVTNQQGIGKGLYSHDDLAAIHDVMSQQIEKAGGRIDAVYYAPHLAEENSEMRKPGAGMALQAKKDFPQIDLSRTIMIGDSESDMQFAHNAGIAGTVFIGEQLPAAGADTCFPSLAAFAGRL